ncbi:DNA primase [Meiothermus ruber]|jgi:DNA primase|uniref:DNA primase n=1 Tax=Meiothermus ruber (strain ATCC 35948 / DSM 1279 / VKM B-1258 / 21) TaxID=504728 RepID=D3PSK9_MEIRD|nr:DNA primase [Meiothermus ruber]ADD28442.1 DNA primase [Meiothermus ruber DSM 1279]AGK06117.1 DNA primase [Meiothermus ruber DSM 1279]MCL6528953.1 DNA primase [Meiothermus ruber]MCX7801572.1 DNA primase [Meiothermus ruber]
MDAQIAQAIELIRSRMPIRELVGRYVALKPSGKGVWKGLCPFHQEKTPSFQVSEDKGLCYCFGCKNGGDIFAFLQKIEGIGFREALERLAQETGVELPQFKGRSSGRKEALQILELTQAYFRANLSGSAERYLQERGLNPASIERFGLGYAPKSWDGLIRHLQGHGVDPQEAVEAGVLVEREGRYFDRFRHRVTFPVLDPMGRIVAFTARALEKDDNPKYLNSPETALFKKSQLLYGYPQARSTIRERGRAVVVEGLFDVIALHQMGFTEAVAVLGSSLSGEQAHLLRRADAAELYLAFDADEAGRKATLQSLNLEIARSFVVYAVLLEDGKDPGDLLLLPDGKERFEVALEAALPEVEYRFEAAAAGLDLKRPEHKQKVLEALKPRLISSEPFDPVVEKLKAKVISALELSPRALEDYLARARTPKRAASAAPDRTLGIGLARPDLTEKRLLRELDVIALLYSVPEEEFLQWALYVEDHTWPPEGSLLAEFMQAARSEQGKSRILRYFEQRGEGARLMDVLMKSPSFDQQNLEAHLNVALARVREVYYELRLDKLKAQLNSTADLDKTRTLTKEIQEVLQAIEAERRVYKR